MFDVNEYGVALTCRVCEARNRTPFDKLHRRGQCGQCGSILPYVTQLMRLGWEEIFWQLIKKSSVPVLVAFVEPGEEDVSLEASLEVVASRAHGDYVVVLIEAVPGAQLAQRLDLRKIPSFILYKQGIDMGRLVHALDANGFERYVRSAIEPM